MRTALSLLAAISAAGLCCLASGDARACTTFLAVHAGQPVVGKNYDWNQGAGQVTINPRGLQKRALTFDSADVPAVWTSKYGSVTFNQFGAELPNGGLNEQGLVIEIMWLDSTQYPPVDSRPALNELQWIQRGLDSFATVDELANDAPAVRVSPVYARVHYLACDASANCAAFEHINGQLAVTRAWDMPAKTLTNDTYPTSASYLASFDGFGGTEAMPSSPSSLDRFVRASMLAQVVGGTAIPDSAFTILDRVALPMTVWSIVYAPKDGIVHFRTAAMPKQKSVRLADFPLACGRRRILDIDTDAHGSVGAIFVDYSQTANRELLVRSAADMAAQLPAGAVESFATYPDSTTCATAGTDLRDGSDAPMPVVAQKSSGGCSCALAAEAPLGRPIALLLVLLIGLGRASRGACLRSLGRLLSALYRV